MAAGLAISHELRSLAALHLAAAHLLPRGDLLLATWDRSLHGAASTAGVKVVPDRLA